MHWVSETNKYSNYSNNFSPSAQLSQSQGNPSQEWKEELETALFRVQMVRGVIHIPANEHFP